MSMYAEYLLLKQQNLIYKCCVLCISAHSMKGGGLKSLRSTLSCTVDWRGSAVASFSALQMKLAPWSPRPTWTRISLRPTPVPSSSSNELALPRKQITPFNRVFQVIVCGVSRLTNSPSIKRVSDTNTFSRHKKSSMNVCRHQQSGYIVCLTVWPK